jgi:hypothetical protein
VQKSIGDIKNRKRFIVLATMTATCNDGDGDGDSNGDNNNNCDNNGDDSNNDSDSDCHGIAVLPMIKVPPPPKNVECVILEYVDCKKGTIFF